MRVRKHICRSTVVLLEKFLFACIWWTFTFSSLQQWLYFFFWCWLERSDISGRWRVKTVVKGKLSFCTPGRIPDFSSEGIGFVTFLSGFSEQLRLKELEVPGGEWFRSKTPGLLLALGEAALALALELEQPGCARRVVCAHNVGVKGQVRGREVFLPRFC